MGNLTKKTITRGAVVALALSAGAATTANAAVTRVSGADRYATASKVAGLWPTSTTAVLAAGEGHNVDALTVAPLAKQKNAPIILVNTAASTASIVAQFSQYTTVYIANGTGVVSPSVEAALTAAGKTVIRLGGASRYETALNIAKAFGTATDIVIANGDDAHLVDSLSIASIAAAKGMPIFLTSANSFDSAEATYAKGLAATNAYVLGGTSVVSDAVVAGLGKETRLSGAGRYETNAAVVTAFEKDAAIDMSNVYIASGEDANLIDSLVAAPLAGLKKAPIVFAHNSLNADVNTLLGSVINKDTNITVLGGLGAVSQAAADAVANIQNPGSTGSVNNGVLAVSSVSAINATTLQVKFSQAPADTSKVAFNVTREGTPVTLTTSWDSTNTVASLVYSSNLPEDTYAVDVMNGTTDLGSTSVAVTSQKIAKIEITSTTLGVEAPSTTSTGAGIGFATYKVLDQYGADISTSSLAQGIQWTCGIGSASGSNGLITITPFSASNYLTSYTSATINGIDESTGVTSSANLTVTQNQGTLSGITLNKMYCANNSTAVLTAGDTTDTFYIDFTATDLSGNATTNYKLIQAGLMGGSVLSNDGTITGLISSNSNDLKVTLIQDPNNSNNALIQVSPTTASANDVVADEPIVITAFTSNGKSGNLNVTLKKAASLAKFTLMAPATTVAAGDSNVVIPFTAVDQNGVTLTKYSDLFGTSTVPKVSFSGSLQAAFVQNPDGTASLQIASIPLSDVQAPLTSQNYTIQSVVQSTGQFSTLNIAVQAAATPNTLSVTNTVAVANMESGSVQNLDFGANFADLAVKDQFGRVMDMTNQDITGDASYYFVKATTPSGVNVTNSVNVSTTSSIAAGNNNIQLIADASKTGSTTVTYTVEQFITTAAYNSLTAAQKAANTYTATSDAKGYTAPVIGISPVAEQYTVVLPTDIKSYTVGSVGPLYGNTTANGVVANFQNQGDYVTSPNVYGLTSGGGKVALKNSDIIGASVDNPTYFSTNFGTVSPVQFGTASIGVFAKNGAFSTTTPTATGNLNVTILGEDGLVHTATTALTAKSDMPIAKSVAFSVTRTGATEGKGANVDVYTNPTWSYIGVNGNNLSMTIGQFTGGVAGHVLSKYIDNAGHGSDSLVYFYGVDQYGTDDAPISTWAATAVTKAGVPVTGYTLGVDANNKLTCSGTPTAGDIITLTGVTSNGLIESVNITVN